MAKKHSSPSFVLTLELEKNPRLFSRISDELEICRVMYNTVLGQYLKREEQMKRTKTYKKLIRKYKGVSKKLTHDEENAKLVQDKKNMQQQLKALRETFQLTEYASHEWVKAIRNHFGDIVNAAFAQKTASRAWLAFQKKLFGKAKKVHFIRKGDMGSFEGKTNTTGWRYIDRHIVYQEFYTPVMIKKQDDYVIEVLTTIEEKKRFTYTVTSKGKTKTMHDVYHVKFVRIVKKVIRGKIRYFADLVIAGYPPKKGRKLGRGNVGLDIGTSSLGVSSLTKVSLFNLAEQVKQTSKEIRLMQRKMDRSKRALNPENYQPDGTIKKGKKEWIFSHRYRKLRSKLKELFRKQTVIRKVSHRTLANTLLECGDTFYVETMHFKALQKRKKDTEVSEKTDRYKRKKRFGKSLGHRGPGLFVSILEQKVKRYGGTFTKINTQKFKASQYCHVRNDYVRKQLAQRWHVIDQETSCQRDLYSAFLLMNANKSGTKANRKQCNETFSHFQTLHDQEVERIRQEKEIILNSGIIVNI